jgi:hypothetical protein
MTFCITTYPEVSLQVCAFVRYLTTVAQAVQKSGCGKRSYIKVFLLSSPGTPFVASDDPSMARFLLTLYM